jgi:hypothetical protein
MIVDFGVTNFGIAISDDFEDQSCTRSTIYLQVLKNHKYVGCKQVTSLV